MLNVLFINNKYFVTENISIVVFIKLLLKKDETTSGKVLELICLLKRKDNRSYSKFLQVLEDRGCHTVVAMLKLKSSISGSYNAIACTQCLYRCWP